MRNSTAAGAPAGRSPQPSRNPLRRLLAVLGPGLMMAGAAIGVSHLVQSTRAGADYGFTLMWVILLANVLKYPFFEYGHRFTAATGQNLLEGYLRQGRWVLGLFFALNLVTAVTSIAGVTFVTAALAENLFVFGFSNAVWSAGLLLFCVALTVLGHYRYVEGAIKAMLAVLFFATVSATLAAAIKGPVAAPGTPVPALSIAFLVALLGWMPAPIEVSVWNSLWVQAKERALGRRISLAEARWDFNLGYVLTILLALIFTALGALVMFGSGESLSGNASVFSKQLVQLYGATLGELWMPVVAAAAFSAMLSTVLTVVEAYPRSLAEALHLLAPGLRIRHHAHHSLWMVGTSLLGWLIVQAFLDDLTRLIDLVTSIAFLSAPVFAVMNYRLIFSDQVGAEARPGLALRLLSWAGILFLAGFSLFFLYSRYFAA